MEAETKHMRTITVEASDYANLLFVKDELMAALEAIAEALRERGGSYWLAREYLDKRAIYNGDLNDTRVLNAVARAALAKARA